MFYLVILPFSNYGHISGEKINKFAQLSSMGLLKSEVLLTPGGGMQIVCEKKCTLKNTVNSKSLYLLSLDKQVKFVFWP